MDRDLIYATIRQEILEQKRCQFQVFTAAIALTSGILAFAAMSESSSLVFVAPIVLNTLAMLILLNKAISIQRKVGYLQLIEGDPATKEWSWETDLDTFRTASVSGTSADEARKHSYITMVGLMLLFLNVFCLLLYFFGPGVPIAETVIQGRLFGWMDSFCILVFGGGIALGWWWRSSLVSGDNTTAAIKAKWLQVINNRIKGC